MLEQQLAKWDGKSTDDLTEIYLQSAQRYDFLDTLVRLSVNPRLEIAATWLLKRHIDGKGVLNDSQVQQLYAQISGFSAWQAKLHLLQIMQAMPIQLAEKRRLEHFLKSCLAEQNKFVRAWSYNGLFLFAQYYPEARQEVAEFLNLALHDEAASIKARVRKLLRLGFDSV